MTKIGLFDSGVGGLTVLKELLHALPDESYVYFGDTARVPYGGKSPETIMRYSFENTNFIIQHDVDILVIPCNTASSIALSRLQKCFSIPIIGVIDPVCKKVQQVTKTKRIGVIGTKTTISSGAYQTELKKHIPDAEIFSTACPLFVPVVEEQLLVPSIIQPIVKHYLAPLKKKKIDTLILGCTHYPLLTHFIQEEMGEGVQILNPAQACTEQVLQIKSELNLPQADVSALQFFVSDDPKRFKAFGEAFLQTPMKNVQKISYF